MQLRPRALQHLGRRLLGTAHVERLALVGEAARRFFIAIKLESDPETSLQALADAHGTTHGREKAANTQADPHCTCCGGGESTEGNEILLCDGLNCANNYHQRCCNLGSCCIVSRRSCAAYWTSASWFWTVPWAP